MIHINSVMKAANISLVCLTYLSGGRIVHVLCGTLDNGERQVLCC